MAGQAGPQPPTPGKHGPPPHANQRRLDYPPGKDPNAPPGASPPSQGYPGYPPQGQQQRMPAYGKPKSVILDTSNKKITQTVKMWSTLNQDKVRKAIWNVLEREI